MNKIKQLFPLILIVVVGSICYSNSLHGPFVFDDAQNIVELEILHLDTFSLSSLTKLTTGLGHIRPVAKFTFAVNYYLGKLDPFGYHIVNLIIHLLTGIFVYLFIRQTLLMPGLKDFYREYSTPISLITSLTFIAHPIQTQAVTYIVQHMSSLAAMFFVLALYCYIKARLNTGIKRTTFFIITLLSMILALGSKENAITLPIFIILYEYYFFQKQKLSVEVKKYIYIASGSTLLIIILTGIYYLGLNPLPWLSKEYARFNFTPGQRVLTQFRVVIFYIGLLLAPFPPSLNLDHDFPLSYSLINPPTTLVCMLLVIGVIFLSFYLTKKRPLISFALIWFWGNLVLESSFLPLDMVFEHRLYLPSIGFFLLVTIVLVTFVKLLPENIRTQTIASITALLIMLLGMGTFIRNKVWSSEISLWSDVAQKSPNKPRAHNNLGSVYSEAKQYDLAIKSLKRALEIKPNFVQALYNLGLAYHKKGEHEKAKKHLEKALKLQPKQARIYHALGDVLSDQKQWGTAIKLYQQALNIDPEYTEVYYNLGTAHRKTGEHDNALEVYKKLDKLKPNNPEVYLNIGRNQLHKKLYTNALASLTKALQLKQNYTPVHYELGKLYFTQHKDQKAAQEFAKVITLDPNHLGAYYNLGLSYQNMGEYDKAIETFNHALKLAPKNAGIYKNLGIIYLYNMKDNTSAAKYLNKSLELDPKQPQTNDIKQILSTIK